MSELTYLQQIQLNSLMIYDPSNTMAEIVYNLKQVVCETRSHFLKKSKYLFLHDLKDVECIIDSKIKKIYKESNAWIDCYFQNVNSSFLLDRLLRSTYFPTRELFITIRIQVNNNGVIIYTSGKSN